MQAIFVQIGFNKLRYGRPSNIIRPKFWNVRGREGPRRSDSKEYSACKDQEDLQAAYNTEKSALDSLNQNYADGLVSQDKYEASVRKLNKEMIETKKALLDNANAQKENSAEIKSTKTLLDSEATSVNALRAQLAQNTVELNKMSEAQRTTSKEGVELTEQTKALSDKLKELEKSVGDNRRNVGNYAESVKDGILQTQGLSGGTGALVGAMKSGITGVQAFNAALKANPILFIVTTVLTLIGLIEKMIKRNSDLSTSLKAAFAPFQTIIGRLLDYITELFAALAKAFEWLAEKITWLLNKIGLISDATLEAARSASALEKEMQRIYKVETDTLVPMARMKREMEELKTLAADQNKSTEERRKLLEKATEKLHAIRDMEVQILEAKYKQIKAQNELGYTSDEDARKEQEALAALEQARANYATQEKEIYGQLTGYEKADAAAKQANIKAALDARRKAAEDAEKAEVDAARRAADERAKAQQAILKQYADAIEAMQLQIAENEMKNGAATLEEQQRVINAQIEAEKYKRQQNLIGEQEYLNNVKALQLEFAASVKAEEDARMQADRDRKAMEIENQRQLDDIKLGTSLEADLIRLNMKRDAEVAAAEAIGAETDSIYERYDLSSHSGKRQQRMRV